MKYEKQIRELLDGKKLITCPKCEHGNMQHEGYAWKCIWRDCHATIKDLPSPIGIEGLKNFNNNLKFLQELKDAGLLK